MIFNLGQPTLLFCFSDEVKIQCWEADWLYCLCLCFPSWVYLLAYSFLTVPLLSSRLSCAFTWICKSVEAVQSVQPWLEPSAPNLMSTSHPQSWTWSITNPGCQWATLFWTLGSGSLCEEENVYRSILEECFVWGFNHCFLDHMHWKSATVTSQKAVDNQASTKKACNVLMQLPTLDEWSWCFQKHCFLSSSGLEETINTTLMFIKSKVTANNQLKPSLAYKPWKLASTVNLAMSKGQKKQCVLISTLEERCILHLFFAVGECQSLLDWKSKSRVNAESL